MRFVHRCQLRWADFDAYRHLNNVRYVELFQEARIAFAVARLGGRGVFDAATVVARQEVDYLLPLEQRPGWVDVSLWVTRLGRASVTMATEVSEPGAYAAHAAVDAAAVGSDLAGSGVVDFDEADSDRDDSDRGPAAPTAERVVYARGSSVMVGWDVVGRCSRRFDDDERAVFVRYTEEA